MKPQFTISVCGHNLSTMTESCLRSLWETTKHLPVQVIFADNGSSDETSERVEKLIAEGFSCQLVKRDNVGYVGAHTGALELAEAPYFVISNNDVTFGHGWIEAFFDAFQKNPKLGVVGPRGGCNELSEEGRGGPGEHIDYVEGALMMLPTALVREIGLFDPDMTFIYCEDSDLSLRLRQRGYEAELVDASIGHMRSSTNALARKEGVDITGYEAKNSIVLRRKWDRYLKTKSFKETVLIRRRGAIGDVIHTTPVIHQLKLENHEVEITVETGYPYVFDGNPDVVKSITMVRGQFDKIFDLNNAYEKHGKKRVVEAYAEVCGVKVKDERPRVYPSAEDREFARSYAGDPYAVIHAGPTHWDGRNWGVKNFSKVAQGINQTWLKVLSVGRGDKASLGCGVDLRDKLSFGQLAALIEGASLFVGIDAMPMHLAQAALIPTVATYGAVDPRYWLLDRPFIRPVQAKGVGCLGCHHEHPRPCSYSRCVRERPYCMERITPMMVLEECARAMEAKRMAIEISRAQEITGWMTDPELTWLAEQASKHRNVLEVGSYKGRSGRAILDNLPDGGKLTCVDWMEIGGDSRLTDNKEELQGNLASGIVRGKTVEFIFKPSKAAARYAGKFDMIFIDGSHDYDSVVEDIKLWREHLEPGGMFCGHDYYESPIPEVQKAVDTVLPERKIAENTTIWYLEPRQ